MGQADRVGQGQDHSPGQTGKGKSPRKLTPADLKSPAFEKWFGDSQGIHPETGEPLIFYHGSPTFGAPSGSFTFGENQGEAKSPMAALGHFFTESRAEASGYSRGTGNVNAVALRMENPHVIDAWQLPIFSDVYEAKKFVERLSLAAEVAQVNARMTSVAKERLLRPEAVPESKMLAESLVSYDTK